MHDPLKHGHESFRRRAWDEAYQALTAADRRTPLEAGDAELLATAAYLVGRHDEYHRLLERAHQAHQQHGDRARAARCAFWLGLTSMLRGDSAHASGWLARARRLVEGLPCVEHGYLLLPEAEQHLGEGAAEAAHAAAAAAVELGERFGDADLIACARHLQGRAFIHQGRIAPGLALLDDTMLSVVGGDLSPIMAGLMYCSVIEACQEVFALGRSREWTAALSRWCDQQPSMVAFTDACLVHRAEIMQLHGAWSDALTETRRACEASARGAGASPPAAALYREGEIHRLRGDVRAAEEAYRKASRAGGDPQPGLALLRLAQGRTEAACAAIRRALDAASEPARRARLLPAAIEITIAAGDVAAARAACGELQNIADRLATELLAPCAACACGAVTLAEGNPRAALAPLGRAFEQWRALDAPYEAARARVLIGQACRALGDEESAVLEMEAARAEFERLGAMPDLKRLDGSARLAAGADGPSLTPRERQVVRLIAAGKTNRGIAEELRLSERTVDRHVSNILTKLDVPSRAAATAWAYRHKLL